MFLVRLFSGCTLQLSSLVALLDDISFSFLQDLLRILPYALDVQLVRNRILNLVLRLHLMLTDELQRPLNLALGPQLSLRSCQVGLRNGLGQILLRVEDRIALHGLLEYRCPVRRRLVGVRGVVVVIIAQRFVQ